MTYRVTYGGFTIYEGDNADDAYNAYLKAGPYGKIYED